MRSRGFTCSDRKYLLWVDANVYCGLAEFAPDDQPGQDNASNAGDFPA